MMEQLRQLSRDRKIADALLTLRAAAELQEQLSGSCSVQKFSCHPNHTPEQLRSVVGDLGLALFCPLQPQVLWNTTPIYESRQDDNDDENDEADVADADLELSPVCNKPSLEGTSSTRTRSTHNDDSLSEEEYDEDYVFDHEVYPVQIEEPEDPYEYSYAPRILTDDIFQQLVDDALPRNLRMYQWKRIYSIAKDGDLFLTMMEKCYTFRHTLLVLKTSRGQVLGGYASEPWRAQEGHQRRHAYFGTGTCFLFSYDTSLHVYTWSGVNDYCQLCNPDQGKIAMGGGEGDFGLIVEDCFLKGSSGHCSTFNNPPLTPGIDGTFDIIEFEVYGLLPLTPSVSKCFSPSRRQYSDLSLLRSRHDG